MKKLISALLSLVMLLSLLSACGGQQADPQPPADSGSQAPAEPSQPANQPEPAEPTAPRSVTVTDISGDEVTIEGDVKKIINLWPSVTSSFFVMGAGDLIAGVGNNSAGVMNQWTQFFYPGCRDIMSIGGTEPSVEELIAQEPDLVIIHPTTAKSGLAQKIRETGIPAININYNDYGTMIQAYTILGEVLGGEYQTKLTQWCTDVQSKLDEHRQLTAGLTEEEKPVVYYITGMSEDLLTTMPAGSIMQDWIQSNGGIFASKMLDFPSNGAKGMQVTAEAVFDLNPDVIIVGGAYQHILIDQLNKTDGWKDLDAVKNGRVYNNPYGCFNWDRFGMESLLQVDYALMCIQPEIAAENGITRDSMIEKICQFYQFYNGKELTAEEAGYMLDGLLPDGTAEQPAR